MENVSAHRRQPAGTCGCPGPAPSTPNSTPSWWPAGTAQGQQPGLHSAAQPPTAQPPAAQPPGPQAKLINPWVTPALPCLEQDGLHHIVPNQLKVLLRTW